MLACGAQRIVRHAARGEGMTANHGALEHKQGFFAVFNGEGHFDADRILAEWAKPVRSR
jgi:hypothetical protein